MKSSLYFLGISIFIMFFITSCKGKEPGEKIDLVSELKSDDYEQRIQNFIAYLKEAGHIIPSSPCSKVFILQTNICNSCNKHKMKEVLDSLPSDKHLLVYFIQASNDRVIKNNISTINANAKILIDSAGLLRKYNLSFLRNVKIEYCDGKIKSWRFI